MATRKRLRTTLLVRISHPVPHWEVWSRHATDDAAEAEHNRNIRGRGITAWAWWGPNAEAEKMLRADVSALGDSDGE